MVRILVLYYSRNGNTEALAKAVAEGARKAGGVKVELKKAGAATSRDLKSCDAVAFGSPNYFSYMSSEMKAFFDAAWEETREKGESMMEGSDESIKGKPAVAFTSGGSSDRDALDSMEKMIDAFEFEKAAKGVASQETDRARGIKECAKLGEALAAAALGRKGAPD